ncbi:TonB-dependent receptor domain-containing protein [Sphingomonas carotinifaciens]|uniref:TonB-dependent receptor domain-containing protein n=1 Tax=Sphingomonas carotinifaciens TaxID=1166323 RepID=UPI0039A36C4F
MKWKTGAAILAIAAGTGHAWAQTAPAGAEPAAAIGGTRATGADDIVVTGRAQAFASAQVTAPMIERQSALTSVNDVIKELPGVFIAEGDSFGSSDWATSISIRGFSSGGGGGQQIGSTIDGLPNGGSGYGGGSRANRYLDVLDLKTVIVSQGTADISSRSNEALGGTLNYVTVDPTLDPRVRFTLAGGDFGARKIYGRFDTGEIAPNTTAFVSASTSRVKDWIGGSGKTRRDHVDAKLVSQIDAVKLTGWVSYDDADEAEYGSVSPAMFASDPDHDAYTDRWTGIPYIDQAYRSTSRALRRNLFAYLRAGTELGEVKLSVNGYYHRMRGRGDFAPPYLVDVRNDGIGNPESEFIGALPTHVGGSALGKIYFVNPAGAAATFIAGCAGTAVIPAESAPGCYPAGSLPVMSYRHTHYKNDRGGMTADAAWTHDFGGIQNTLRGGIWWERGRANQLRDWHKITNALIGPAFDGKPYYVQFSTDYGLNELMYYAEDALTLGPVTARFGVKQFFLDQTRAELLNDRDSTKLTSHSDPLISTGIVYHTPLTGLEAFAGYSQNFAAIGNGPLGEPREVIARIKPETAKNIEIGARYATGRVQASVTAYDIKFDNHIQSISANLVTGIDYLEEQSSVYLNVGGIKSRGIEAALAYRVLPALTLSGSYTLNHATYIGTGNAAQDEDVGVTPGRQVINSPRHMWVLAGDYARSIFKLGGAAKFVGDRFIDTAGTAVAASFVTVDAYAGVDLGQMNDMLKGMSLTVQANNLADRRYLAGADGGSAFLGAPRTVTAALTVDF